MAEALTVLLIGCLLQGALCGEWLVNMPHNLWTLNGSCLTIPCSFDVKNEQHLNDKCQAFWKKDNVYISDDGKLKGRKEIIGELKKKNCTTTLKDMSLEDRGKYTLRLVCGNNIIHTFLQHTVNISVRDDPPLPTLTPSTLKVKEETSVSLMCSAPAPCWSHPPTLTWTPSLGKSLVTLQENQNKTNVKTSVLNFAASHLHHGKKISCTAAYKKQDGSTDASAETSLTVVILFPPQILPSSDCVKTASQINCSCETLGDPPPTVQWYLNGLPVSQFDSNVINVNLNNTFLKSFITVNHLQEGALSTLFCRSFNSVGNASQHFCVSRFVSAKHKDPTVYISFITILAVLLVVLTCILLFIRAQNNHYVPKSKFICEISTVTKSQLQIREGNEAPNRAEGLIYANADVLNWNDGYPEIY